MSISIPATTSFILNYDFDVASVEDAPRAIHLSDSHITENTLGDAVGVLTATDPDVGDYHNFQIVGDVSGLFEIVSGTLRLRSGVSVDFEQTQSFTVRVRAIDSTGRAFEQNLTVTVDNETGEVILGGNDTDELAGTANADQISGLGGQDVLLGLGGDDTIDGGAGKDLLFGGSGDDSLIGGGADDLIRGGTGEDTISGGALNDTLSGNDGNDILRGGSGDDVIRGNDGNDVLLGNSGNDRLFGGDDNDTIRGGQGNNLIDGGLGLDRMFSGTDRDVFIWRDVAESPIGAQRDVIYDFASGTDKLNFSGLSADVLEFRGTLGFANTGDGSLRIVETVTGTSIVKIDIDGDRVADMEVVLFGVTGLIESDFIL